MDHTSMEDDGSCPQWQGCVKDALLSVAVELPALRAELRRMGQMTCRPLFLRLSSLCDQLFGMERALATPVLPGLRKAITMVSREMVALNAPLRSKLEAELLQSRDPENPIVFEQLFEVACLLVKYARLLILVLPGYGQPEKFDRTLSRRYPQLSCDFVEVGVLLVDSCALVYGNPMCGRYINVIKTSHFASTFGSLLAFLQNLHNYGQNDLLNFVRRSTFSPDAVIAALRRLLWRELAGEPSLQDPLASTTTFNVLEALMRFPLFKREQDAIAADPWLQQAIVASIVPDLERFLAENWERQANPSALLPPQFVYSHAVSVLCVLTAPSVATWVASWARRQPRNLQLILDSIELFLKSEPPAEFGARYLRFDCLFYSLLYVSEPSYFSTPGHGGAASMDAFDPWRRSADLMIELVRGGPMPSSDAAGSRFGDERMLGFCSAVLDGGGALSRANGALTAVLQQMGPVEHEFQEHEFQVCPEVTVIMSGQARTELPPAERSLALAAKARLALPVLESLVRIAAALLQQLAVPGNDAERRAGLAACLRGCESKLVQVLSLLEDLEEATPGGIIGWLGEEALRAAATSLLTSAAKAALVLAGPARSGRSGRAYQRLKESTLTAASRFVGLLFSALSSQLLQAGALAEDASDTKLWEAMALAAWSTVGSLLGSGPLAESANAGQAHAPLFHLVSSMLRWPEVQKKVLATEAGRGTARLVFQRILPSPDLSDPCWLVFSHTLGDAGGSPQVALALARAGVLTQLTAWAEEACVGQGPQQALETLGVVQDIACAATLAWKSGELASVMESLQPNGSAAFGDPAYWRRMRAEVAEPLASGPEAADGEAEALAVAVTEALASRPCAHVGCTTVAGATEAGMPRGSRCGSCSSVRYCGKACQKADWKAHKAACRVLAGRQASAAGAH